MSDDFNHLTVERFGAHRRKIEAATKKGAGIVAQVRELFAEPARGFEPFQVVSGGEGWLVASLYGRHLLFIGEVVWGAIETEPRVTVYIAEPHMAPATRQEWKPTGVSVVCGKGP